MLAAFQTLGTFARKSFPLEADALVLSVTIPFVPAKTGDRVTFLVDSEGRARCLEFAGSLDKESQHKIANSALLWQFRPANKGRHPAVSVLSIELVPVR